MGTVCEESISNIRTVKAFSTEEFESARYRKANATCYRLGIQLGILNGVFTFFTSGVMNGIMAGIIYFGYTLHVAVPSEVSVGDISAFLLYMIQLIFNMIILTFVFANVYKVAGASKKILEMCMIVP